MSSEGGAGGDCAAESHAAELVPLDIYVILDRSLSMNEKSSGGITKWDAIKAALEGFVEDGASEGIGVGIQYFPTNPTCSTNDDCPNSFCYLKACRNALDFIPCQESSDCPVSDTCVPLGGCEGESCRSIGAACENGAICEQLTESVCASDSVCRLSDYGVPAVPIATLPGVKAAFMDSIGSHAPAPLPFGFTPTGPALEGAIAYAKQRAEENPKRRTIVLLATDGSPTVCAPATSAKVAQLASVGFNSDPPIQTFTIGVFADGDDAGPSNLQAIAEEGAGNAFIISDEENVAQRFIEALNSIRGDGLQCEFQIPAPELGKSLAYDRVNIEFAFEAAADPEILPYIDGKADCDEDGGWFYDVDPKLGGVPQRIRVCDETCDRLRATRTGQVDIRVGCQTLRKDVIR